MAYDDKIADRLRAVLRGRKGLVEKKMFGGIAFMVNGHMTIGVNDDSLMVRVGPDRYDRALARAHAREMDFTGRPLRGFVFVGPKGFDSRAKLESWVRSSLDFVQSLPPK